MDGLLNGFYRKKLLAEFGITNFYVFLKRIKIFCFWIIYKGYIFSCSISDLYVLLIQI